MKRQGERTVQNARLYAAARAERDIAHAKLEALVDDAARFLPDDLHFFVQMRVGKRLLGHHADDLPCAAQPLRVRLHRRDADGLVRAFDDDLRGLGKRRDQRAGFQPLEFFYLQEAEMTPNAFASSAGKPPIHWCSTVVTTTS